MFLLEHQAKELVRQCGILVPQGALATSDIHAGDIAEELGNGPWVVKAQIQAGARASGTLDKNPSICGVVEAQTISEVKTIARDMIGSYLVTSQTPRHGEQISSVYIEPVVNCLKELFLALLIDGESGQIICIGSIKEESHVEKQVIDNPDCLVKMVLGHESNLPDHIGRKMATDLVLNESSQEKFIIMLQQLYALFMSYDLSLIEINPLGVTESGNLIALDARVIVDDNSLYRQPKLSALNSRADVGSAEQTAARFGFNYLRLDGNIGVFSSGAGLAMATIDAVNHFGGKPANFLDIPPILEMDRVREAFLLVLENQNMDCLLVNIFGAGIMRCDTIADALLLANLEKPISIPIILRLAGTNSSLAISRLENCDLPVEFAVDLASAARQAIAKAGDPKSPRHNKGFSDKFSTWFHSKGN